MTVPGVPVSTRRRIRPYKVGFVALLVAATCFYGGFKGGRLSGMTAAKSASADHAHERRLKKTHEEVVAETPHHQTTPPPNHIDDGWAALNAFGLIYMFLALSITCDEFFVPALDVISDKLKLSPDIAGATFMAAGGSAPEFFTSMVGALAKPPSDVGISTIVGSAVFNVLFVIGACGLASPKTLQLTWYPLARDSFFYVVHLVLLCVWFYDGEIQLYESATQFFMYIIYCVYMSRSEKIEQKINDKMDYSKLDTDGDGLISRKEAQADKEIASKFDELDKDKDGKLSMKELKAVLRTRRKLRQATMEFDGNEEEEKESTLWPPLGQNVGVKGWIYYILSLPLMAVLILTVPDCRREGCGGIWKSMYIITFTFSILWVAVFSYLMVECSVVVGDWTQIDQRILALTLIAAGTSVPDLLTSVIVTLQGHGDMAISSSIGSNIFDVTVGLPVPWLIFTLYYGGEPVRVDSQPLTMAIQIGSLVLMLVAVVVSIMYCKWVLNKALGGIMIVLYVAFMCVTIYQVMNEPQDA